jgi:hypothetical protein
MLNIPYLNLTPGNQSLPQLPRIQATQGRNAQGMQSVGSALGSQSSQQQGILEHYMNLAQQPNQSPPVTNLAMQWQPNPSGSMQVQGPRNSMVTLGGQVDPTTLQISQPDISKISSFSSHLPSWIADMWS